MKDLTNEEKTLLIRKIKSFLDITWEDEDVNDSVWDMIVSSANRIDEIFGQEIDYLITGKNYSGTYNKACCLGFDLLKNRCFYIRNKGLDDFEKNYSREINSLYLYGKILKDKEEC